MSGDTCEHVAACVPDVEPRTDGCEECLRSGQEWVALRMCTVCGHVGCCDSSAGRHATKHWHATGHSVMRSAMPGQDWMWCYDHGARVDEDGSLIG